MKRERTAAYKTIISNAKRERASEIFANAEGHTKPPKLKLSFNKVCVPDAAVKFKNRTDLYLIETSINKKELGDRISQWIMVSAEARKLGGQLIIMAAESIIARIRELIEAKMIRAVVVPIVDER